MTGKQFSLFRYLAGSTFIVSMTFGVIWLFQARSHDFVSRSDEFVFGRRETFGFPLTMYDNAYPTTDEVVWTGVLGNMAIIIVLSLILGLLWWTIRNRGHS